MLIRIVGVDFVFLVFGVAFFVLGVVAVAAAVTLMMRMVMMMVKRRTMWRMINPIVDNDVYIPFLLFAIMSRPVPP